MLANHQSITENAAEKQMMDEGELEEKREAGEARERGRERRRDGGMHRRGDRGGAWRRWERIRENV